MKIALLHHASAEAKRTKRAERLSLMLSSSGHGVAIHDTDGFVATRDARDADLICICGGDGTVRRVLAGQHDLTALPPVAIYPTGTINLLSRELGYPGDPAAFLRRIERPGHTRSTPVARIGEERFFACASMGLDALAVARVSLALKARIGRFAYVHAITRLLRQWPRHRFEIVADDVELEAEALFVMRGRFYAGPWTLDRGANLGNRKLHVLAMPKARMGDVARLGFYAVGGARQPDPDWRFMQVSSLQVRTAERFPVQADGDILTHTPIDIGMTDEQVRWA